MSCWKHLVHNQHGSTELAEVRADDKQVPCGMTLLVESVMLEASCLEFSAVLMTNKFPSG